MGTLSQRYNEEFLNRAEERKEKLQYEKLTVGRKTAGRVDHILNLLFQTHQNYYFGYHEAAVCLSGILLEQALTVLLEEKLATAGRLKTRYKNRDPAAGTGQKLRHLHTGAVRRNENAAVHPQHLDSRHAAGIRIRRSQTNT